MQVPERRKVLLLLYDDESGARQLDLTLGNFHSAVLVAVLV